MTAARLPSAAPHARLHRKHAACSFRESVKTRLFLLLVTVFALAGCEGTGEEEVLLRVERLGEGSARVTSLPPRLDCEPPCEASFAAGSTVALDVQPGYGSTFLEWRGCPRAEREQCTLTLDTDRTVAVVLAHSRGVRLSDRDRGPGVVVSEDGLAADFGVERGAVRTDHAIGPGTGVFYVEVERLIDAGGAYGFGIATAEAPLTDGIGADAESFGLFVDGSLLHGGEWLGRIEPSDVTGLVVDYRGSAPVVHVITEGAAGDVRVAHTQTLEGMGAPLYVMLAGSKSAPTWHLAINPGNDTVNAPFAHDARAALRESGLDDAAEALTLGWGTTYAGEPDEPPRITIEPPPEVVARGAEVTLHARAHDSEDGDLTDAVAWELLSSSYYAGRVRGRGPAFSFAPSAVGLHPVRASVRDSAGHVVETEVRIRVPGPVSRPERVRLAPDARSGPGVELSSDGLAARWTAEGKNGIRANQSLYGAFWYFEIARLVDPVNQGGGLVVGDGNLGPYTLDDVPPSCSINVIDGVYRNLIWQRDFSEPPATYDHYGFAVDYRGEHPLVYVIVGGEVIHELLLDDVWVEVFPMLYGNPTFLSERGGFDAAINFGEQPFAYDAHAILEAHGVDARELAPGWGIR